MSRKQALHLINTNYNGIATKIKEAKKKGTARRVSKASNKRTA